jgi:hypothetical protein
MHLREAPKKEMNIPQPRFLLRDPKTKNQHPYIVICGSTKTELYLLLVKRFIQKQHLSGFVTPGRFNSLSISGNSFSNITSFSGLLMTLDSKIRVNSWSPSEAVPPDYDH